MFECLSLLLSAMLLVRAVRLLGCLVLYRSVRPLNVRLRLSRVMLRFYLVVVLLKSVDSASPLMLFSFEMSMTMGMPVCCRMALL